jgi:hypothetical protein
MQVSCLKNLNRSTPAPQESKNVRRFGGGETSPECCSRLRTPAPTHSRYHPSGRSSFFAPGGMLLPGSCLIAIENAHAHRRSTTAGCMLKTNERTNDGTTRLSVRTYLPCVTTCCRAANPRSGTGPVPSPQSSNKVRTVPIIKPLEIPT